MKVQDFILAIRRRWYMAVAALVLAVGATIATVALVGPSYEAKGATLLVPPGVTLQQQRPGEAVSSGNPYLELSGLSQARDIVIRSMTSQTTFLELCAATGDSKYETMRQSLCRSHPQVSYTVTPDFESSAPVILVTVQADTPDQAVTALGAVMNRVPAALRALQGGLNLRARADITSTPLVADVVPVVVRKDQIRAAILVGGGSLAAGLLLTGLLDSLLLSRGARTKEEPAAEAEVAPGWGWADGAEPAVKDEPDATTGEAGTSKGTTDDGGSDGRSPDAPAGWVVDDPTPAGDGTDAPDGEHDEKVPETSGARWG